MVFDVVSKPVHIGGYFLISSKYAIAFVYSGLQCLAPNGKKEILREEEKGTYLLFTFPRGHLSQKGRSLQQLWGNETIMAFPSLSPPLLSEAVIIH